MITLKKLNKEIEIECKRLNIPYILKTTCPECGEKIKMDFTENDYLSYPIPNKPFNLNIYCKECCEEFSVQTILNVKFTLVKKRES